MVIEYTYNAYGKELTRKTYHKDSPNAYMFSEYTYEDGSFIKSERDPRYSYKGEELKTTYENDVSRNLLLKQTSVSGQEYNYSYDDKTDDLTSLSSVTNAKQTKISSSIPADTLPARRITASTSDFRSTSSAEASR